MPAAPAAGMAYFTFVLAAEFVFGTVRVPVLTPHLGEIGAVLLELPIMLAVSWVVVAGCSTGSPPESGRIGL
jgi:hypothetical protein